MGSKSFKNKVVGIFTERSIVDSVLNELNNNGYEKDDISVLAKDMEKDSERVVSHSSTTYTTDVFKETKSDFENSHEVAEKDPDSMIKDTATGIMFGAFAGLAALMIPGVGPVLAAGPIAMSIAAIFGGAAIGATAGTIIGLLKDEGIPNDRADFYHEHFNKGDVIVMVHTNEGESYIARNILEKFKPHNMDIF